MMDWQEQMDCKLALQLKEAHFGVVYEPEFWTFDCPNLEMPSLAKLIMGCYGMFANLILQEGLDIENLKEGERDKVWRAESTNGFVGIGRTPEIAVGKLWLKLNKN